MFKGKVGNSDGESYSTYGVDNWDQIANRSSHEAHTEKLLTTAPRVIRFPN